MRIVIDMQGAQTESRFRGIGRYTMSLAQAIVRNRGEHEIILVLSGLFADAIEPIRAAFDDLMPQDNIHVWYAPGPVRACELGNDWRREVAELIREAFIASLQPDVVLVTSFFEGFVDDAVTSIGKFAHQVPTAVIFYDLIPLLNRDTYLTPNPSYECFYQQKIEYLKRANQWLAISESAANEGRAALTLPTEGIVNISTSCSEIFRPLEISEEESPKFLTKFDVTKPFILYSGGADIRKNLKRLILAYAALPTVLRDAHQLVYVGRMPEGEVAELWQCARSVGINEGQLKFTGYVTDEELASFYSLCTVFVLPSLHEGFGLPALEAMACGAAVIGSNTTSIPEVIGRLDALFDPYDEASISHKLAQVLGDGAFCTELGAHGLEQSKKFSWHVSAKRAIGALINLQSFSAGKSQMSSRENFYQDLTNTLAAVVPPKISDSEILEIARSLSRAQIDRGHRQLLIDISELVQRDAGTGIQRVTRSILKELLASPPDGYEVVPVYATRDSVGYRYARHFTARFCGLTSDQDDDPIDYRLGDVFLGLDLQHHIVIAQKDYLVALRRDGVKVFFVVYDLLPVLMPHVFPSGVDAFHKAWLETLMSLDGAVCISRAVANELKDWQRIHVPHRMRPFKIDWFHLGADVKNSVPTRGMPDDAPALLKEIGERPTFLIVGTVEPRKGNAQTLSAFDLLWSQSLDVNLVIVGKQGWKVDSLVRDIRQHSELGKRLFWLEGISDEYLNHVYRASTCLIAASVGEGFGLPIIEAAQYKLSIIARDIPVFREVAGEHALYFSGIEPKALAEAVKNWLALVALNQAPQSTDMKWLTWKESAQQLKNVLLGKKNSS
jgi:glycosyltransferase involved in cell wall biosynthesis